MVLNGAPHAESQRALQCVASYGWRLGKRNQGVHIPAKSLQVIFYTVFAINTRNDRSSRGHLVQEAQHQQLTPFTSIVPLNFEAATVSLNPEGFTAPV